jgi:hypothetical protein
VITPRTYTPNELATVPTIDLQYHYEQMLAEEIHRYKSGPVTTFSLLHSPLDDQMDAVKSELVRRLGSAWRGGGPAPSPAPPIPRGEDGRPVIQVIRGGRQDRTTRRHKRR